MPSYSETFITKCQQKLAFSCQASEVSNAGRELWRYYHAQPACNVNASFYDIREYFQERKSSTDGSKAGNMNAKSVDETYNTLLASLRGALKILTAKIQPKVYEYGFLKEWGEIWLTPRLENT